MMRIKNGLKLKRMLAAHCGWYTVKEVATGLEMSTRTAHKLFRQKNIDAATARKVADVLGVEPLEIAEFVN